MNELLCNAPRQSIQGDAEAEKRRQLGHDVLPPAWRRRGQDAAATVAVGMMMTMRIDGVMAVT